MAKLKKTTGLVTGLNTLEEEASEALQVVHYAVGGHYEPHVDYFGAHSVEDSRGDRVATVLFYLSENMLGGGTVFPLLNLAVKPVQGSALIWYNTQRNALEGEMLTLHAGCPVIFGRKWIANLWLRQRPQIFHRPCPLFDE